MSLKHLASIESSGHQHYLLSTFLISSIRVEVECFQSQNLDLTIISSLVDATLHTRPAANWTLELQEVMDEMGSTIGIRFTTEGITDFQSSNQTFFHGTEGRLKTGSIRYINLSIFDPK